MNFGRAGLRSTLQNDFFVFISLLSVEARETCTESGWLCCVSATEEVANHCGAVFRVQYVFNETCLRHNTIGWTTWVLASSSIHFRWVLAIVFVQISRPLFSLAPVLHIAVSCCFAVMRQYVVLVGENDENDEHVESKEEEEDNEMAIM